MAIDTRKRKDEYVMTTLSTLKKNLANAKLAAWSASCASDRYVDMRPYWADIDAARKAMSAAYDLEFYCHECDFDWQDHGTPTPCNCPKCGAPVVPDLVEEA
jgi:hypothetical protein